MPSKKRKYNARFPAGRIKKIMQTDEEVGKVAQAVPIIISRTLELFVESLLTKAFQVTVARSAKTLSPAHVKHCILAEARFDFLRHLVKNIPDVSAAEEKDELSAENSPNSSRFPDMQVTTGRVVREDSNSSSSSDARMSHANSSTLDHQAPATVAPHIAVDLTKKITAEPKRTANFYNETLNLNEDRQGVIKINPTYATAQPSTSGCTNHVKEAPTPVHNQINRPLFHIDYSLSTLNNNTSTISTPLTPLLNIDFSKGVASPEIKVLDTSIASLVGDRSVSVNKMATQPRSYAKASKDIKKVEIKAPIVAPSMSVEHINSGNLQIDEDYDT